MKTKETFSVNDGTVYKLWSECGCGCGAVVRNRYAQGHDMKAKSQELARKAK